MTTEDMNSQAGTGIVAVGFDGSAQSRDALALAADLSRLSGARVAVVVVYPLDFLVDLDLVENQHTLRRDAEAKLSEVSPTLFEGLDVELHTAASRSDARGLHDTAEKLGADLLVVGSSHRGTLGRVLLGSVGTRLLHGSPCAVAVAPYGYVGADGELRVIAAAYDGSSESRTAVVEAAGLAAAAGGTLRIIAVAGAPTASAAVAIAWSIYDAALADQKAFLDKEMDALVAELPPELHADGRVLTGNPATVILEEAAKGVDLLVVGSRGYGVLRRVMLGSVSAHVLGSAPCAVLVTPRGIEEHERAAVAETAGTGASA
jgi:nucleotide-binding universal stress UspA family protein